MLKFFLKLAQFSPSLSLDIFWFIQLHNTLCPSQKSFQVTTSKNDNMPSWHWKGRITLQIKIRIRFSVLLSISELCRVLPLWVHIFLIMNKHGFQRWTPVRSYPLSLPLVPYPLVLFLLRNLCEGSCHFYYCYYPK